MPPDQVLGVAHQIAKRAGSQISGDLLHPIGSLLDNVGDGGLVLLVKRTRGLPECAGETVQPVAGQYFLVLQGPGRLILDLGHRVRGGILGAIRNLSHRLLDIRR